MRKCKGCFTVLIVLFLLPIVFGESVFDQARQRSIDKSVVMIRCVKQQFDYETPWKQGHISQGMGTGFIIDAGRILTNAHNVSDSRYIEVVKEQYPKRYPAQVEFIAHDCDLAILKVEDQTFFEGTFPLTLGDLPKVNSTVQTYGFPVGGRQVSVTEGVVSRIQIDTYSHSGADSHLVIQTDAAINPGNSGGPVMQDQSVVGVAFQGLRTADNIGYLIPTTVIRHFLADIEDGRYDGFGSLGVSLFTGLHNTAYSRYLKLPAGQEGVVVLDTTMNSSVENILQRNDVITRVGGYDIDNDGKVFIHGLRLHLSEVIEQKQIGDKLEFEFYRDGEKNVADAEVALNRPVLAYWREYDKPARYYVYAGLTFVPLNRNFLETWGRQWLTDLPHNLRYLFADSNHLNKERERKEYVVLSEVLPDTVNNYCGDYKNQVVTKINGHKVMSLKDLPVALANGQGEFTQIEFFNNSVPLVIDKSLAEKRAPIILEKYQVPAVSNLEGENYGA